MRQQKSFLRSCVNLSVADPVHFLRDPDPDPTYLDMFLMFSKINILYGIFLPNLNNKHPMTLKNFLTKSKHPMTLKIKDKKLLCLKSKIKKNYLDITVF